eukprot:209604-Pyramimonas_sp.AAC.1
MREQQLLIARFVDLAGRLHLSWLSLLTQRVPELLVAVGQVVTVITAVPAAAAVLAIFSAVPAAASAS